MPLWVFSVNAVAALIASFLLLALLWPVSRLAKQAEGRNVLPPRARWLGVLLANLIRAASLLLFAAVLWAALFSPLGSGASIAPVTIFVVFWVGVQFMAAIFGDIWRLLSPWDTLATLAAWIKSAVARSDAGVGQGEARSPLLSVPPRWASGSFAVAAVAAFLWMELVHPEPNDTRLMGWLIFSYTALVLTGASLWGRRWLRENEGFAVLFNMIGAMGVFLASAGTSPASAGTSPASAGTSPASAGTSPASAGTSPASAGTSPASTGQSISHDRLKIRWPMTGLAKLKMTYARTALVLAVLGCTTFDGLSGTLWWTNLQRGRSGWETVPIATLGFAGCVLAVTLGYYLAMAVAAGLLSRPKMPPSFLDRQAEMPFARKVLLLGQQFSHSLVPLLVAYSVAHYFSLFVFEGQDFIALLSDPFALGWDLFGTAHFSINYRAVSADLIAWVQALSIVIGHVAGVMVAHDRAVELFPRRLALKSQYPLLAVMVGYTITGLLLLLKA